MEKLQRSLIKNQSNGQKAITLTLNKGLKSFQSLGNSLERTCQAVTIKSQTFLLNIKLNTKCGNTLPYWYSHCRALLSMPLTNGMHFEKGSLNMVTFNLPMNIDTDSTAFWKLSTSWSWAYSGWPGYIKQIITVTCFPQTAVLKNLLAAQLYQPISHTWNGFPEACSQNVTPRYSCQKQIHTRKDNACF